MLAGLSLKLEVAQNRVRVDNPAVAEMLGSQITETTAAIDAVRRMVRDLRPPAVDDLGLVGALREQALRLGSSSPVRIHIEAPDDLPTLPAATETAAFHIASEAMTNAIRHSSGTFCRVAVSVDDALHVVVEDDGAAVSSSGSASSSAMAS